MNLRPSGYEPDELPDCSTPHQEGRAFYKPTPSAAIPKVTLQIAWRLLKGPAGVRNARGVPLGTAAKAGALRCGPDACQLGG